MVGCSKNTVGRRSEAVFLVEMMSQCDQTDRVEPEVAELRIDVDVIGFDLQLQGYCLDQRLLHAHGQLGRGLCRGGRCRVRAHGRRGSWRRRCTRCARCSPACGAARRAFLDSCAITGQHQHHRLCTGPRLIQRLEARRRLQRVQPLATHSFRKGGIHLHSAVGPQRPVHRQAPSPALAGIHSSLAMLRVTIHEGVRRRIIGLAGIAEGGGHRGKDDQKIQCEIPCRIVEIEQTGNLRSEHGAELLGALVGDPTVLDDSGAVHHAIETAEPLHDALDALPGRVRVGDVQPPVLQGAIR